MAIPTKVRTGAFPTSASRKHPTLPVTATPTAYALATLLVVSTMVDAVARPFVGIFPIDRLAATFPFVRASASSF